MTTVTRLTDSRIWWRWTAAAGAARMPGAMALLALVFLGKEAAGSYASGAALAGVYALSEAVAAPWRGHRLGLLSARARRPAISRSLRSSGLVLTALAGAGHAQAPIAVLAALTALAAVLSAGVPGAYRALLAELLEMDLLRTAFSWDAAILEVEWLLAPLLVSAALLCGGPTVAVLAMGGFAVLAGWGTRLLPPLRPEPAVEDATGHAGAWKQPQAWPCYVTSLGLGIAEGGLIAVLPALLLGVEASAALAGPVAAVVAAASALGGLVLGAWGHRLPGSPSRQSDGALVLMCLALLPAALATTSGQLVVVLACGGVFIAPVNSLRAHALHDALSLEQRSEGFSIQNGANGIGVAAGAAIVAALPASPPFALAVALSVPLVTAIISFSRGDRVGSFSRRRSSIGTSAHHQRPAIGRRADTSLTDSRD